MLSDLLLQSSPAGDQIRRGANVDPEVFKRKFESDLQARGLSLVQSRVLMTIQAPESLAAISKRGDGHV
jgi:hypothetical protein